MFIHFYLMLAQVVHPSTTTARPANENYEKLTLHISSSSHITQIIKTVDNFRLIHYFCDYEHEEYSLFAINKFQ